MTKLLAIAGVAGMFALGAGPALASPCGGQSATMLRRYGLLDIDRPLPPNAVGNSSAASTEPTRPGGVGGLPITTSQQQAATELLKKAIAADGAGNAAACAADVARAQAVLR